MMNRKMKKSDPMNLLIINDYGIQGGGTETRIRLFVDELLKRNAFQEIHILQKFPETNEEKYNGTNRIFFHTLRNLSAYFTAKRIIKKHTISLVQAHNLFAIKPYCLLAAKHANIPVVWWVHDYWLLCAKRSFIDPYNASKEELCEKASNNCHRCMSFRTRITYVLWKQIINYTVDHAIAPARILQDIHEHNTVLQGKWSVIVPWIDSDFFSSLSLEKKKQKKQRKEENKKETTHTLLFVGSLVEFKGAWVAAQAMKKICAAYSNAKLLFVGGEQEKERKERKEIEGLCQRDGTSSAVFFLGKKTKAEIRELQQTAAAYLCPTVCMESFGLNWAEAMAAGIPVVASAIGSIPEYVKDNECGLLFPARNHEALADCVIKVLTDSRFAKHIAQNGQNFAQKQFRIERAAEEILEIYNRLRIK